METRTEREAEESRSRLKRIAVAFNKLATTHFCLCDKHPWTMVALTVAEYTYECH